MAIALRSTSESGTEDTNGTSCTVPVPAGAAIDDIALLAVEMWETFNPTGVTPPSGFNLLTGFPVSTGTINKLYVWYKRLTAADTGSYVTTWTDAQWNMGHCVLFSGGLASGDPIEAINTATGTGTSIPSTSVVIATLAALAHFVCNEDAATQTTVPTNFTEQRDGNVLHTNTRIPGSTGTFNADNGVLSAATAKIAALIAIKPAAGAGTQTVIVPLLDSVSSFFNPTITPGAVSVVVPLLESNSQLSNPAVVSNIQAPRLDSVSQLFNPTISTGLVTVTVPRLESISALYNHTVSFEGAPPAVESATIPGEYYYKLFLKKR